MGEWVISLDNVILFSLPAALIFGFETNVFRMVSVDLLLGASLKVGLVNVSPLAMMCFLIVQFKLETVDFEDSFVVDPSCLICSFSA